MKLMKEAVEIYRELAQVPQPTSASISNTSSDTRLLINSQWSQRDLERSEKVNFQKSYVLSVNGDSAEILSRTQPQESNNEIWSKESPSGRLKAIVRKIKNKKNEEKFFIEVWNHHCKIENIDLDVADKHGEVYNNDDQFGCFEWSASEGHLLYIAEKKVPKSVSYFDNRAFKSEEDSNKCKEDDTPIPGDEHVAKEDWGERLVGKCHPVLCILDVETGVISVLENVPDHVSPGQARWGPEDGGVLFVGWPHEPWKLGLSYCPIRRSNLYYLDLQTATCNSLIEDRSIRCPMFSPDFSQLLYLDCDVGGPHLQCSRLMLYDWKTKSVEVVIDQVNSAEGDASFTGINVFYGYKQGRMWSNDGKRILLDVVFKSRNIVLIINIPRKTVQTLTFDTRFGLVDLMDIYEDWIIVNASAPDLPDRLFLGKLPSEGDEDKIIWEPLDGGDECIENISWSIHQHTPSAERVNPKYKNLTYETILLLPEKKEQKPPLLVFPHGGPHSVFTAEFLLSSAFFCKLGFAVLKVNYRGSFGYGQDSIFSLPGNIGDQDIKDVQAVVDSTLESGVCDTNNVVVLGGSHGGFITGHLIGQYPDFYKAAVLRNPVINVATKAGSTDIPDWNFVEAGLPYEMMNVNDGQSLNAMWEKSPIRYVDKVKTPVMIVIGLCDLRVPPAQGKKFYKALKSRNVPVRFLSYPDNNHSISKVDAEADSMMNIYHWFAKHIQT